MSEAFQHKSATVVAAGAFAPASFHPLWFERYGLLGKQEAAAAAGNSSLLVTDEIALFKVAGFDFDIRPERFQVGTPQENLFGAMRDLFCSTLNILEGTKVTAVGVNWTAHLSLPSEAAWHTAGHKMIPHDMWTKLWSKHVGMKNVTVELQREDKSSGFVQVVTQPSRVLPHGMYIHVNDHFELAGGEPKYGPDAAKLVEERWAESGKMAEKLLQSLKEVAHG